jgi:hypothetical protein
MQAQCEAKLRELETAQQSLSALQQQLDGELSRISEQQAELIPSKADDGGKPSATEKKARDSLERFQKLCRDAKRKAVGAG